MTNHVRETAPGRTRTNVFSLIAEEDAQNEDVDKRQHEVEARVVLALLHEVVGSVGGGGAAWGVKNYARRILNITDIAKDYSRIILNITDIAKDYARIILNITDIAKDYARIILNSTDIG